MRKFVYSDAKSHKFWNIELTGASFTVTYGKVGTTGAVVTKTFPDAATARTEHDKLVAEKLRKGYVEQVAVPRETSLREALEAALVADPDDLASHMAYADWLHEQGDPRGEFIQTQLALEDPNRSPAERKALQKREARLLKRYREEWLGDLAEPLLHPEPGDYSTPRAELTFVRGWLQEIHLDDFRVAQTQALARSTQLRLLRKLSLGTPVQEEDREPHDDEEYRNYENPHLYPLIRCNSLGNVRSLIVGDVEGEDSVSCHASGEAAVEIVKRMPRLEELYLMAHHVETHALFGLKTLNNLRVLLVHHVHKYPLKILGANSSLTRLTTLRCHPHGREPGDEAYIRLDGLRAITRSKYLTALTYLELRLSDMGDEGAKEIVASGILKRLKVLDLRHGKIGDAGARLLANCPDVKNLERLELTGNCLTGAGVKLLRAAVPGLAAASQWTPTGNPDGDREYLWQGDIE